MNNSIRNRDRKIRKSSLKMLKGNRRIKRKCFEYVKDMNMSSESCQDIIALDLITL